MVQDNSKTFELAKFAEDHVEPEDRPAFIARVEAQGLDAKKTYPMTPSVRTSGFKMASESGMVLVGDLTALDARVKLPEEPDSRDR